MIVFIFGVRIIFSILAMLTIVTSSDCLFGHETNPDVKITILRENQRYTINLEEFDDFDFQSGDRLAITPEYYAAKLIKTPDDNLHMKTSKGTAIRIPQKMILTPFKEYLIPEHLCVLTGMGTHSLESIGQGHIANYKKYIGLWSEMTFLEIGCGIGRDAFQLLHILDPVGKYIGVDITHDSILWLQKNVSSKYSHFHFYHFDAIHELYNPLGSKRSCDFRLPAEDHTVDRIALGSVFTHLFEDEIVCYLLEIKRVLKPDGLVYATFFLYDDDAVQTSRIKNVTPFNLRFEYPYGDGCFANDAFYKTGAVAYTYEAILRMLNKADLKLARPLIRGSWSGLFPNSDDGQDVAIIGQL